MGSEFLWLRVWGLKPRTYLVKCVLGAACTQVISSPEVARVYIGSFWNNPLQNDENRKLFEAEANDLYSDIARVPRDAAIRKLNDFIKRARLAKVHALLLNALRNKLPMFGKESKKKQLISQLATVYQQVAQENGVPLGDFPPLAAMQEKLATFDWSKIPRLDTRQLESLDTVIKSQIPKLMSLVPTDSWAAVSQTAADGSLVEGKVSPFLALTQSSTTPTWALDKYLNQPVDVEPYRAVGFKAQTNTSNSSSSSNSSNSSSSGAAAKARAGAPAAAAAAAASEQDQQQEQEHLQKQQQQQKQQEQQPLGRKAWL
ncbi:hypothetical protein Emed_002922 [Eimeria media]